MTRIIKLLMPATIVLTGLLLVEPAFAAVSVARAEVSGAKLRIEGTAIASRDITVDGVVMGRSDGSGEFEIRRDPYTAPADCTVSLGDGSAAVTEARLSGCTVSNPPAPTDTTAPTAPTGLSAGLAGDTATLSWTASTDNVGVTGYRVSRNGTLLAGTVTGTTFTDPGLAAGTYTYTVTAVDAAGNVSVASNSASVTVPAAPPPPSDTTAPTVPGDFAVVLRGNNNTDLTWTASTDDTGVTGYRVTRNGTVITTVLNPFYGDTSLPAGTYTYSVAAMDAAGNVSGSTESISVTVQPPPETDTTAPSVPTDLTTTVVGTTISVGWSLSFDDTRVAGYTLTRNGVVRATTDTTSFTDSGLAPGTYTYTVTAFDAAGNTSQPSNSVSATVEAPEGLTFITPSQLPDATLGQPYLASIVASDPPGPSTFKFKLVSGRVPTGTRFLKNTLENRPEARVSGTPSARGTYSFTVEVEDNTGATARRTFTIRVL